MSTTKLTLNELRKTTLVLSPLASSAEALASRELAQTIKQMTGVRIKITKRQVQKNEHPVFLIGEATLPDEHRSTLPVLQEDEVELRTLNAHRFLLRGGGSRGSLYAVYEWLDQLGCRWFHPQETSIPKYTELAFPQLYNVKPGFEYRETLWYAAVNDADWACRNRFNGSHHTLPQSHGGRWGWEPYVHTFHEIVPVAKYAKTHPQYYAFRHGQGRVIGGAHQLCLSNPDVLQLAIDFALTHMKDPSVRIVDISQNDCVNFCQCRSCALSDRKAGSPSGSLIRFVNQIAEATSRVYPDKFVATLAYTYTQTPPRQIKAHQNVIIRLCHMDPACDMHPLATCPQNEQYIRDLTNWKKVCERVYVWHYVTNFHHYLAFHPNLDALAQDIRFYRDLGIQGIFFQAQGTDRPGLSFGEMHSYAQARLAWNPDRDYWHEASEFVYAYYGDAGAAIMDLLKILHENARNGFHAMLQTHPAEGTFTSSQLRKAETRVKQAERCVVNDPKRKHRVAAVRLWLNYTCLTSTKPLEKKQKSFRVHAAPKAPQLFKACLTGMKQQGIHRYREFPAQHDNFHESFGWSLKSYNMPLVNLENDHLEIQVAPELAGMICTLKDKATGHDLFCKPAPCIHRYPYMGGYTESYTSDGFGPGFCSVYIYDQNASDDQTIVLRASLGEGIHLERCISLAPDTPTLNISSVYINRSRTPKKVQPYAFVNLSLGQLDDIGFFCGCEGGQLVKIDNTFPSNGTVAASQWVNLNDEKRPVRQWGLYDQALKIGLVENIGRARPLVCGSNAYLRDQRVMIETLMPPRKILPGNQRIFRHQYTVIHAMPKTTR